MHWKLFATLREATGHQEVAVEIEEGATIRDALDALLTSHPELEDELFSPQGELYNHIRLLQNGDDPFLTGDGFDADVGPDDELALFPPVSGG